MIMEQKRILNYLITLSKNNDRDWFHAHKAEYDACRNSFEQGVADAIERIAKFDAGISHLTVKDTVYRFNRDTRFSPDKSPYKNHLGAYICAKGKKALHGGYYLHIEPGNNLLSTGCYWLPTNILTACRNEIMGNIDTWRSIVETPDFVKLFGKPNEAELGKGDKGFGIAALKVAPTGFPRDYEHIEYLRMKDYCCWTRVEDDFFEQSDWLDKMSEIFLVAKPMMDFINAVIDDYE